ncbi:AAA family ATPase [Benzoatithermus flavus]|uniref:AAA family ATPase n=1 Tax=Benzoatithermus flavus TaxID=3108223 RepID=A0ABU8XUZ9_9PROT
MLTEFRLENFKSYRQAVLPLAPLTLLIGANASGKSNAIEALRFLSWLAQDHKLSAIRYEVQQSDDIFRGTVKDLPYRGAREFRFGCRATSSSSSIETLEHILSTEWQEDFSLSIALRDEDLRITDESISGSGKVPLYSVTQPATGASHDIRVAYNNFARGGKKPQITCSDQQLVLLQLQSPARFEAGHAKAQRVIPAVTRAYQQILSDILFLDPAPRTMRGYSFKGEKQIRSDGRNLSGVLHELWEVEKKQKDLLDFIASLPEQNITSLGFISTPRGEVMAALTETFGGEERQIEAPLLSDGTLRVLAVAAALLTAPRGSMVVIEEIDNGVHPSRARLMMNGIRRVATQRGLRVLLTTHNPALMDALPDEALGDVVFCFRDPEGGYSRLVRLSDLERAPSLLAQGSLGELVTAGVLDRSVKARAAPSSRDGVQAWLEDLEQIGSR